MRLEKNATREERDQSFEPSTKNTEREIGLYTNSESHNTVFTAHSCLHNQRPGVARSPAREVSQVPLESSRVSVQLCRTTLLLCPETSRASLDACMMTSILPPPAQCLRKTASGTPNKSPLSLSPSRSTLIHNALHSRGGHAESVLVGGMKFVLNKLSLE